MPSADRDPIARDARPRGLLQIGRALAAIRYFHVMRGLASPTTDGRLREIVRGVRRTIGIAQVQKAPILIEDLRSLVAALPPTRIGTRDRALLTLGFASALRRSELVALDFDDISVTADGLIVQVRRSKTDQEGEGRKVGVPFGSMKETCPVRSTLAWTGSAAIADGPLFRRIDRHDRV